MGSDFFRTPDLFWSFWANVVFTLGMIGYLVIDGLDYMNPNALSLSLFNSIYVVLAAVFIFDSSAQLFSIYKTPSSTQRYYVMVVSCVFDAIGSDAYFLGALFEATAFTTSKTVWLFNTVGVCGFVIGAAINMLTRGSSIFYSWANILNLLGALLYLLATIITIVPATNIIIIIGDVVYIIDAVLYIICWFSDRQSATVPAEQILLVQQ